MDQPARSTLKGCDREFYHEMGCPAQGSYQDCTCYVSRIRLVKTPVGDLIPTTEPDLSQSVRYWKNRAESWSSYATRLRAAVIWGLVANVLLGACVIILLSWVTK